MTEATEKVARAKERQCRFIDKEPVFAKSVGGIRIDPSEYQSEKGTYLWDRETECKLIADPGEKYCPRHKAIMEARRSGKEKCHVNRI